MTKLTSPTQTPAVAAPVARLPRAELVKHLSRSLGQEKAEEVINETATRLGFGLIDYSRAQTLALLEELAATPGLVGVVARFAKARVILAFVK